MALGHFRLSTAWIASGAAALGLLLPPLSRAQAAYEASARVAAPRVARSGADATSATTSVDLRRRIAPLETAADVLLEIPGARVTASGGYGAFASVSLRGNEAAHTTFWLGAAPLDDPESGSFDITLLPLGHFARLEVFRGGAPLWLAQGAIAGAVRLVPRDDPGQGGEARLGAGSFGLVEGLLSAHVRPEQTPGLSWFTSVQVTRTDADYPYLDDRHTRFDPSDDLELTLRNAQVTDASGLSHLRVPLLGGELEAVAFGIRRLAGLPGAAGLGSNALQTRRSLLLSNASVVYTRGGQGLGGRGYELQALASGRCSESELHDPFGELGTAAPRATHDLRLFGFARVAASHGLTSFLEASALASYAHTDGQQHDDLRSSPLGAFSRTSGAGALELRLFGTPLGRMSELRASARAELTEVDAAVYELSRGRREQVSRTVGVYRAGFASELWPWLKLRGSVGTGARPPTAEELFGDGANVQPNPELLPERGLYADTGFVLSHTDGGIGVSAEVTGFLQDVDDKIILTNTNQFEVVAENLGYARIHGVEAGVELALGAGPRVIATATALETRGRFGRQLPLRPRLRAFGVVEQAVSIGQPWAEQLTAFVEIDHESTAYYDPANLVLRPPLTRVGCGLLLALLDDRVELAARMADVFDARGQDYLRFPLPGRSLFFSATIKGG